MGKVAQRKSGSTLGEKLRAQIPAGYLPVSCLLDRLPPLRRDPAFSVQPVPNKSLAGIPVATEGSHLVGQRLLASSNVDGPLESQDVRFVHGREAYTTTVVKSNTPGCMTSNNTGCNVSSIDFRTRKNSQVPNRARKKISESSQTKTTAVPGPDGKTLGQRLSEAMSYHEGVIQRKYTAQDLYRDVNRLLGASLDSPAVTQQSISKILVPDSKVTTSKNSVYFARVLGVDGLWLSSGIGSKIPR